MRILLIGPNPPPHGGISVHVAGIHRQLAAEGVQCRILDIGKIRPGLYFLLTVLRHALAGWTLHLHTNGHNLKSWLIALACGVAGQFRGGAILTLHSGMVPAYLATTPAWRRSMAARTCALYRQVICVSDEVRKALLSLGVDARRTEVLPAFLNANLTSAAPNADLTGWIGRHRPLFSTVLFFRPEYGFDILVSALSRMRSRYPSQGCLVMGSGEQRAEAENLIRDAGLEESILLLGDMDHDSCLSLIARCDVFLRPTRADGDSISVREALALGVPVVASRVGARPPAAHLFEPGDVDGMIVSVESALAKRSENQPAGGSMNRLMEIYRQVDGSEGSLCLN